MEPFGIFEFLQKLLEPNPPAEEKSPPPEGGDREENLPPTHSPSQNSNPAAAFLEQHEKRASRLGRKP